MTNRLLWQAASICLRYPVSADLSLVRPLLPSFVDSALAHPTLAAHYVETFDFINRHSLYLTWYSDGDTRRRGQSLVELKRAYRAAGLLMNSEELPDFLPTVLEYSARTDDPTYLSAHHGGLVLLEAALTKAGTIYALPVRAVLDSVPAGAPVHQQPPLEMVGLQ